MTQIHKVFANETDDNPMCETLKDLRKPLCLLLALGMVVISPLVLIWVALIYVIALIDALFGIITCAVKKLFGHPCGGSSILEFTYPYIVSTSEEF